MGILDFLKSKKEGTLDDLAEEIVKLMSNSKKLEDILNNVQENKMTQTKNLSEIVALKNRIKNLEKRIDKSIKNSKINAVEAMRLMTERYEEVSREDDAKVTQLASKLEELKDMMVRLSKKIK
jgi:predicted S18 family serine protease